MERRRFVRLGAGVWVLRAAPVAAEATPSIRLGTGAVEEFALPYYALQRGFFRDAGLTVDLQIYTGGGLITQAVVTGALDVGITNSGSMAAAHVRGLPIYLLASDGLYTQRQPGAYLIAAPSARAETAADLGGKTIGITTLRDLVQAATMAWIEKRGGNAQGVHWFELGSAVMGSAIASGRIDAAVIFEPQYTAIRDQVALIGLPYDSVNDGKPFQTSGAIANKTWVDANPEPAARVTQALQHAAAWANANPIEAGALLAQLTKMTPATIASFPRVTLATKNDPGVIQPVIDVMARYGFIPHGFPATELTAPQTTSGELAPR